MRARWTIGTGALLVLAFVSVMLLRGKPAPSYDRAFDTRVSDPVYRGNGPTVLFDEGHLNTHTIADAYKPFADLLRNDGYAVQAIGQPFSEGVLQGVTVLVLVLPRGANDTNDDAAYTDAETAVIETWVRNGGSLLLVTDHWPYGRAAASLARRFDVAMGCGLVEDPTHHDVERGDSHLVFSADNGLLGDHPITRGRSQAERVRNVLTFTGQSLLGPEGAVSLLALSDAATERPPTPPKVIKEGGNTRVEMVYGDPMPAAGRSQGLALEWGAGRIVILGEAGMLRAQRERDGTRVGMNVAGTDNRQLALNIMHWLSRAL